MALLHVHRINNKKVLGVGLIESLIALALFSGILALYIRQTESVSDYKKAKIYSDQTNVFARDFANQLLQMDSQNKDSNSVAYQDKLLIAKYKKDLIAKKQSGQAAMQIVTLNDWDNKSLFNETPCLLLYYDDTGKQNEMSGLLYYVTNKTTLAKNKGLITLKAINENNAYNSAYFKDNSSILSTSKNKNGDNIVSNNGWGIKSNIIQYIKTNACGTYGTLADNSLLLNMQLIPEFNNRLVSVSGLQKTADQSYSVNLQRDNTLDNRFLPGHLYNNNTFKSNLSIDSNILLDNTDPNQPTKMNIAYGTGGNATLNIGKDQDANNSAFITSAIQPNTSIKTGTQCQDLELGKVAIAQKETISQSGQADSDLARNLVTCSKNATLCSTGYCYLPIKSTTFSFSNANGLQDDNTGIFRCPAYAPYVVSFNSALVQPNVDVFTNNGGITTASFFKTVVGDDGLGNPNVTYSNIGSNNKYFSRWYNCNGGCNRGLWAFLRTMDFSEANIIHGSRLSIATVSVEKIYNSSGTGLQSPVGLKTTSAFSNCDNVCSGLGATLGGLWGNISTIAPGIGSGTAYTGIPANKCACGKVGGQSDYWIYGIALIENVNTNITNVICSNYPEYKFQ